MATSKTYYQRSTHRFLSTTEPPSYYTTAADQGFELDESDLYASVTESPEIRRKITTCGRKSSGKRAPESGRTAAAASLPMNIPDWSKILREEYRGGRRSIEDDYDEDDDVVDGSGGGSARVPPHEFLARTRMASFSVHEGVGRTLKGRDLSRVRNAIFEKTGFQD